MTQHHLPQFDRHAGELGASAALLIVEVASDAIFVVDASGQIEFANQAAERTFGYDRAILAGLDINTLVPDGLRRCQEAGPAFQGGELRRRSMGPKLDTEAHRSDGSVFPVEMRLSALPPGCGAHLAVIVSEPAGHARAPSLGDHRHLRHVRMSADLLNRVVQHIFTAGVEVQAIRTSATTDASDRLANVTDELDCAIRDIRNTVHHENSAQVAAGSVWGPHY
ncbi:MAG: PAS domain S-box protein [Acidimicrobiales bacterium]|jgi:PAS domain S-box-containing protein